MSAGVCAAAVCLVLLLAGRGCDMVRPTVHGNGTVIYLLESYGIVTDDGKHYDPEPSLPQEFEIDSLRVHFLASIVEQHPGIRMWGTQAKILRIERL